MIRNLSQEIGVGYFKRGKSNRQRLDSQTHLLAARNGKLIAEKQLLPIFLPFAAVDLSKFWQIIIAAGMSELANARYHRLAVVTHA
jgi:hypothetical protein